MTLMMRAGVASEAGLKITEIPRPAPQANQVLVKVAGAGMNRTDLSAARGAGAATKASLGKPIGREWAGEIVETGDGVAEFKPGDQVVCSGIGGYADYAVADVGNTIRLAPSFDMRMAAVLPLVLMTAHDAVISNGTLQPGGSILVQGASSAVGLAAMQIARWRGASVIAGTSTNPAKRDRLAEFGATHVFDPADAAWTGRLLQATGGRGVDTVVDMVSGASINTSMKLTAIKGRIVNVGRLGAEKAEFDFDLHAARRLTYIGVTFRTRSAGEVQAIVEAMKADLWDAVMAGRITLPIDRSFALADGVEAHGYMAADKHFGKLLLIP